MLGDEAGRAIRFVSIFTALPISWAAISYVIVTDRGPTALGITIAGVLLTVIGAWNLRKAYNKARSARLGFLGECAVAEALEPLVRKGWRVFHDLPMEVEGRKFNIDHVAVGPGGIWAVETKAFSKAKDVGGEGNSLKVDGEEVVLPDGRRRKPLKQARGCARALQVRCNKEGVGVKFVEPLVVMPGWYITYGKDAALNIRDPRNVVAFLERQEERMSAADVEKVSNLLETWCRVLRFDPSEKQ